VSAVPGNGSATVSWTAPSNGGSAIISYTVTPYIGSVAQPTTTVTGNPPATSTPVTGLTNGTSYTFTVTATNAVGAGSASAPSPAVTPVQAASPTFVQQATNHGLNKSSLGVAPGSVITAGNRLIVEVGIWNSRNATAKSVTDSAGNTYTELLHYTASDGTEQSIWTAPITAGGGTKPTVTATPTSAADVGLAVMEYSGLSTASGTGVLDQETFTTGTTSSAATVTSGATPAATANGELAIGFYTDSGFGDALTAGAGFTKRSAIANVGDMELLAEDQTVNAGTTPEATVGTGANTIWLMSTLVFKHA
jgi:hypothetical protein